MNHLKSVYQRDEEKIFKFVFVFLLHAICQSKQNMIILKTNETLIN
jgi:hypothetical protein